MGSKTGIEWTDSTWSPIRFRVKQNAAEIARAKGYTSLVQIAEKMAGRVGQHCEHISPGCTNCYAEGNNHRCLPGNGTGLPYDRRSRDLVEPFIDDKILLQPLKWWPVIEHRASCEDCKHQGRPRCNCPRRPRRIFVENQSDLFGEWVTDEMIYKTLAIVYNMPQHQYQFLTKRPWIMLQRMQAICLRRLALTIHKLWSNERRDDDTCILSPRDFLKDIQWPLPNLWLGTTAEDQQRADERREPMRQLAAVGWLTYVSYEPAIGPVNWSGWEFIRWLISGGESGAHSRPSHLYWHRDVRDWCQRVGVKFFFKQWGQWVPSTDLKIASERGVSLDECMSYVRDKHAAGAMLDGREWKQFPAVCQ